MVETSDIAKQLKSFKKQRGVLKAKLTTLKKFLDTYNSETDKYQLLLRKEKLIEDNNEFETVQSEIETIVDEKELDEQIEERISYQEGYYSCRGKLDNFIKAANFTPIRGEIGQQSSTSSNINSEITHNNENLNAPQLYMNVPKLELPKFSGSYESWPGFSDAFKAAVHRDSRFTDAQKLIYLRSCLTGKAANKIESLGTTDANYLVAWNQLEKYYNDPNAYINKRIKAIFDLPICSKPNAADIGEIVDNARKHYRALEALNRPFLEAFPIYAITSKLDEETRLKWKERVQDIDAPTMEMLLEFLHLRQKILEGSKQEKNEKIINNPTNRPYRSTDFNNKKLNNIAYSYQAQTVAFCHICKGNHFTQACEKLLTLNVNERIALINKMQLCLNCLRSNHTINNCKSALCKKCNNKHHTLLHKETTVQQTKASYLTIDMPAQVLLSTALIHIIDKEGNTHICRVLLDSCSQSNFITEEFANRLNLDRKNINIPVNGINNTINYYKESVKTEIQSRINQFSIALTFLILPNLPETLPSQHIDKRYLSIPKNLSLADPLFYKPSKIDALIGAEIFYQLLSIGQMQINEYGAVLQKTRLGWIIGGKVASNTPEKGLICNFSSTALQEQISKFWEIEEISQKKHLSIEEAACESHFVNNTIRDLITGQYIVKLPFNESKEKLGESYNKALKRFLSLERSLNKNSENKTQYTEFMHEYEALGHMTLDHVKNSKNIGYFLPHHAVIKHSSLTTKLRVVFDASAKSTSGISLNDVLMKGPTIQEDLLSIILRFRTHEYVLTADIEKMYRQILVDESDRAFQKILWRDNENQPIKIFKLNTLTYGTTPASFVATRALKQLAIDEAEISPKASHVLSQDFYMDDLLTGARTLTEAKQLRNDLISLTRRGGLNLRQWASNDIRLVSDFFETSKQSYLSLNIDDTVKTLGVYWNAKMDAITYTVNTPKQTTKVTKREVLSQIARLFDPLGLLGPVIVKAKILMQQLWQLKVDWDESVPLNIFTAWQTFTSELPLIHDAHFSRKTIITDYTNLQLHCFCDASERAYGTCIYIRSYNENNECLVQLLCAKSRVAPLKSLTLPRLELSAAQLAVQLFRIVEGSLHNCKFDKIVFWSDSTITLQWINASPHILKTFVSNRVSEIQSYTNSSQWRHVPSRDNPADLISRGLTPAELLKNNLWHNGPHWLSNDENEWPIFEIVNTAIPECKPTISFITVQSNINEIFERFSTFNRLKRVIAYCFRFYNNCRKIISDRKQNKNDQAILNLNKLNQAEPLNTTELQTAVDVIIKQVQEQTFSKEICLLRESKTVIGNLIPLNPFVDAKGILRVGGRLSLSKQLNNNQKHQALLPKNHHVTNLIIQETHLKIFMLVYMRS